MPERARRFTSYSNTEHVLLDVDLTGKTILITGTNSGIGLETARALVFHGAHIVMANRNIPESEKLRERILAGKPDAKVDILPIDLSSLRTVKKAAEQFLSKGWHPTMGNCINNHAFKGFLTTRTPTNFTQKTEKYGAKNMTSPKPLHVLILNAGVASPATKSTEDGLETTYGVNHVAHFYLTQLLLPKLRESAPSRVVVLTSDLHARNGINQSMSIEEKIKILAPVAGTKEPGWIPISFYANSKLCNILFAFALHRKEHQNGLNVYAVHPGVIKTALAKGAGFLGKVFQFFGTPFFKSVGQGAATTVYCAVDPELNDISGRYFENCWDDEKGLQTETARDEKLQDALWNHTEQFLRNLENTASY